MTRRSKALTWANELKERHIKVFEFNNLPEDLRDLAYFRQAVSQGIIIKVKKDRYRNVWRVRCQN